MKKSTKFLWGAILIILGVYSAASRLWGLDFNIWSWWSLIILLPCVSSLFTEGPRFGNLFGIGVGLIFLPPIHGIVDFGTVRMLFLPVILILCGISLIFKEPLQKNIAKIKKEKPKPSQFTSSQIEYSAIFSAQNVRYPNEVFEGADLDAIFGGIELDLRNAVVTKDILVKCTAVFGGIEIWMPSNVNVKVTSIPIFGGASNKCNNAMYQPDAPTIYVDATCMFGGVEVK